MKKYLTMIGELVLLLGTFLGVSIVHNDIIVPNSGAYGEFVGKNLPIWITVMFAITSALIAIIFQVKKRIVKERYESIVQMSNFSKISKLDATITTLVGIFTGIFFICFIKLSFIEEATPDFDNYINMFMNSQSFIVTIIGLSIIGPLFEEVLFRGILFNIMRRKMPFIFALVVQAVFYAYCQPNLSVQFISFFLAIMYGILYYRLKSIWSTLLAAGFMNTVIFVAKQYGVLDFLSDCPDHILMLIAGVSLFFMIVLVRAVWKGDNKSVDLRMIGNLLLWTFVYSAFYYPFIFIVWNQYVMGIDAISPWLGRNNVIGFIPYDILAFVIYYYIMKWVNKKDLIQVSNFSRISLKNAVLISILGIAMGVWVQMFFKIPYFEKNYPQFDQLTVYLTDALFLVYFAFLIVHSMYKEIYFRAMIYNVFRTAMPVWVSVIGTGIVYGGLFFNWDIALTIYATLGALIFSFMFEWYKSIWAPIINEFFVFAAYYGIRKLNVAYGPGVVWALGISSVVVIGLMVYLWKNRETGRENEQSLPTGQSDRVGGELHAEL
ncbi:Abortive infection protein [Paenibacillus curdlanolyticus YK9]|uniref:Abortive infection protein n=1 Tax=Paenibacillus curdlanolyticus YK9 TaxID=717606 RepID=E0I7S6_9BACL|nr:CPBP family intramembrane glutamic endopeptidase [Paenibacillus curdlanolyticus]EFM11231.1 Abortive infection protein [Paenibacillus curdlanolyticus YK9]